MRCSMHLLYNVRPCLRPPTLVGFQWLMGSLLDWRISGWFTCSVLCAVLPNHFAAFPHLVPAASSAPLLSPIPVLLCWLKSWLSFCRLAAKKRRGWRRCTLKFFTASVIGCSLAAWLSSWFLPCPLEVCQKEAKKENWKKTKRKRKKKKQEVKSPNLAAVMAAHMVQWVPEANSSAKSPSSSDLSHTSAAIMSSYCSHTGLS